MSKVLWRELTICGDYTTETYTDVDRKDFVNICVVHGLNYYALLDVTELSRYNGAHTLILDLSKIPDKLKITPDYDVQLAKLQEKLAEVRADSARIVEAIDEFLKEI